jgi:hypothetical protein
MLIIFFGTKGIVHKEFVLAGHTVNSAYYCEALYNCVKMYKDFAPNFGDKRTGGCIAKTRCLTLLFSPGIFFFFAKNSMTVVPQPLFSPDLTPATVLYFSNCD